MSKTSLSARIALEIKGRVRANTTHYTTPPPLPPLVSLHHSYKLSRDPHLHFPSSWRDAIGSKPKNTIGYVSLSEFEAQPRSQQRGFKTIRQMLAEPVRRVKNVNGDKKTPAVKRERTDYSQFDDAP